MAFMTSQYATRQTAARHRKKPFPSPCRAAAIGTSTNQAEGKMTTLTFKAADGESLTPLIEALVKSNPEFFVEYKDQIKLIHETPRFGGSAQRTYLRMQFEFDGLTQEEAEKLRALIKFTKALIDVISEQKTSGDITFDNDDPNEKPEIIVF
ncbi:hypothetical protein [Novosphingobium beihaiensis]|uniref:Uncharacterized protein n=1 Tax=Novosphingobium beihaiensis TaxID=2930389 RepID=A0ABT0BSP4_9SPHN|nr:hypothetical protein [Novosphingobium beihaiensis]MCJ2187893.1 hypothetical protein [Novosphingobium beihaiensis]